VERYLAVADALIIGSYFKVGGHWMQTVDFERVKGFMERVKSWK
jgi:predicted TIM-barrel enzyme